MGSNIDDFVKADSVCRCEWHPATVFRLLDTYGGKYADGKHHLKIKDWEEILKAVNRQSEGSKTCKSVKQCRDKVDSLKKRYKLEKQKADRHGVDKVTWSFFHKLDEIMGAFNRSAKDSEIADRIEIETDKFEEYSVGNALGIAESAIVDNEIVMAENSPASASTTEEEGLSDYNLNASNNSCEKHGGRKKLQERSSKRRKTSKDTFSEQFSQICKTKAENPIQALADALVGFSQVYARIEVAKMELLTKINLELAKIRDKEDENETSSSSSANSE